MSTRIAVLFLVLLASQTLLFAQVISGTLEGSVYDSNGGLIPSAQVGIRNTDTGLSRTTATSGTGAFRFDQLEIGPYRLTVTAPGFKRFETVVQVSLGNMAAVRADMQVGDTSQSVEVQASAASVEVNTAEVARSVGSSEMLDIPVLSRNPADLLQLAPGVPAITQDKNGSLTVGGLRPRSTTYNVDGASNNFEVSSGPRTPVILEAVEEVRAVTNVFSAQYGKGSGAVVDMVMKSGTNQFHGNLFSYHRNRSLDATPFYNNATSTGKPAFILNIYGATIGGPVIRDRTFFFAAYQGTNLRTQGLERLNVVPDSLRTALTGDTRSLAGDPAVGGLIRDVFARMPSCQSAGAICVYSSNQSRPQDESIGNLKVDHRFNDNNLLSMRYLIRDYSQTAQSAMGGVANLSSNRDSNLALTYRKVFSPSVLNEVVFARSTFERAVRVPDSTVPDVGIQGYTSIGNSSNLPQEFTNTYYQVLDNFSLMIGKHNIRAGMDALWNTSSGYALFQGRGIYSFQGLPADFGAPDGLTNFRLGRSASFQATRGDFQRRFDNWDLSFYGQDDWRISPRLTLNLGIRYELQLPPTVTAVKTGQQVFEAFDPATFRFARWKSDRNNFSPSVGVAWDPTGKGRYSIRAGYRLAYDRIVQDFYNVGAVLNLCETRNGVHRGTMARVFLHRRIHGAVEQTIEELLGDATGAMDVAACYLAQAMTFVCRGGDVTVNEDIVMAAPAAASPVGGETAAARACRFLMEHFDSPIDLDAVARAAGAGKSQLCREFRRVYGTTVMEYLTRVRIDASKRLLQARMRVGDVAQFVGFDDPYHFSRVFKRITGLSPKQFSDES